MMRTLISLPPAEVLFILKERILSSALGAPAQRELAPEDEIVLVGVEVGAWALAASVRGWEPGS